MHVSIAQSNQWRGHTMPLQKYLCPGSQSISQSNIHSLVLLPTKSDLDINRDIVNGLAAKGGHRRERCFL